MPHITEHKHLKFTRTVSRCPHDGGAVFPDIHWGVKTPEQPNGIPFLIFKCIDCNTEWGHGGLVQRRNGFIPDHIANRVPEGDPDQSTDAGRLAKTLKDAEKYCQSPDLPLSENYWHNTIAETLLTKHVVQLVAIPNLDALDDYLQDLNYEQGIENVVVRDGRGGGTDFMLHCTDPDGEWFIQLTGDPDDYNEGANRLSTLTFPVHVLPPTPIDKRGF